MNGIGPTLMDSPMTRMACSTQLVDRGLHHGADAAPALGLPRELIGAAIFLASDASELVTGHTIMCDDGYLVA